VTPEQAKAQWLPRQDRTEQGTPRKHKPVTEKQEKVVAEKQEKSHNQSGDLRKWLGDVGMKAGVSYDDKSEVYVVNVAGKPLFFELPGSGKFEEESFFVEFGEHAANMGVDGKIQEVFHKNLEQWHVSKGKAHEQAEKRESQKEQQENKKLLDKVNGWLKELKFDGLIMAIQASAIPNQESVTLRLKDGSRPDSMVAFPKLDKEKIRYTAVGLLRARQYDREGR
jgi:uncharacterized FlaG/YvyC family protein